MFILLPRWRTIVSIYLFMNSLFHCALICDGLIAAPPADNFYTCCRDYLGGAILWTFTHTEED